jgi:protein involved in polysaccharide export with SLBB domain
VRFAAAVLLVGSLAACGPTGPGGPRLAGLEPAGVIAGGVPLTPEHTLTAGDQFEIRFPFASEFNDTVTVSPDGIVTPKVIGSVTVGGLTVAEATERLKARYAEKLKSPELSITMRRFEPELIYVDGWVQKPGLIRSDIPLTLERALAQAGGVKLGAKTSDVLIMRHDADGGVHAYSVALGSYGRTIGGDDPLLKSFDVVYVPQTPLAAVSDFAKQYYASVPFAARFSIPPTRAPAIIAPQALAPPPPPPIVPR